ncbi:hypothetical protein UFOVP53_238 [uncultured Caudovirales phage]|uniref:Uncharacterized protein n=1 Tax=uncultured Caudovirales phage TaxID=2100421 RepID=A0A6J5KWU1_9CAUD|nr:hypothetical protein UFOVP53_238 [uncultured Caudovirales phage]
MDSTTGKLIQTSGVSIDDANNITGVASETVVTSIVTGVSAESITVDSSTTGANATLPTPSTPIIKLTNATLSSLDGIPAGIAGQQITLINDTATTVLLNNDTGGTAANRIYTGLSKPLSLKNTASVLLKYDTVLSRWRVVGGSGSGSGSSGSAGGELADLMYSCAIRESFTDILNGTTPTDVSAGKTDATIFDIANELMRMSYDASKTVTGTSVNMTISATPSYTVKVGDVLIYNGEARKISTVTSQTVYVLESAFSTNPTTGACCISQAVHTVDLNNFTNGGLGLSAASQYSGSIDEIMLGYQDSATLNDIIPDFGSTATVAFSASTDASSWTTNRARVSSLSSSEVPVTCPTSNANLYLRFFSNATTGSGAVNLLSYKVFFQKVVGQSIGSNYNTAFARPTSSIAQNCSIGLVSGKTRFTFTFPYTRGLNSTEASGSILEVIANGQIVPRFTSGITDNTQAYFTEINDTTIEMDTDYTSAGIDFQFKVQRINVVDTNTQNTIKTALHDDLLDQSLDAQVVPTFLSAVNGVAVSGTSFRSDITGRASIPNLSSILSVQMGPSRMATQDIYQLQNEFGPAGQTVFAAVNDKFNQIRFVGDWRSTTTTNGSKILSSTSFNITDYVEVVFYGTGLNMVTLYDGTVQNTVASVDGGSEGANIHPATNSSVLSARNYCANQIVNVVSGLTLGMHTVKLRNNSASVDTHVAGFEVLTQTTTLQVTPGTVMKGKYKNALSSLQTVAYDSSFESGTLGTKGGCVLVYLKNDGTIAKAVTPTDTTALYLASTSHANEEIIRVYSPREFGAGRADDFSRISYSGSVAAAGFTLDDGVTTLGANGTSINFSNTGKDGVSANVTSDSIIFTFIGTGLDIECWNPNAAGDTMTVSIDGGAAILTGGRLYSGTTVSTAKICSGLPYGTHTVKILTANGAISDWYITSFIVYAPKKPSLPTGSIELAQYYKMASYVATASIPTYAGIVAQGTMRKVGLREFTYVGAGWSLAVSPDNSFNGTRNINTGTAGDYVEYSFFGTGVEIGQYFANALTNTYTLDGSTNFTPYTTSFVPSTGVTGLTWTPSAGTVSGTPSTANHGILTISGLALGWHKIRKTNTSGVSMYIDVMDIITPIHAPVNLGPYVLQNTLALGNNNFIDLRKFNKKDIALYSQGRSSQAFAISTPSVTSTALVPYADASISHYSATGKVRVEFYGGYNMANATTSGEMAIFVNGKSQSRNGNFQYQQNSVLSGQNITFFQTVNVPIGVNKIDICIKVNTGSVGFYLDRVFTVEDI